MIGIKSISRIPSMKGYGYVFIFIFLCLEKSLSVTLVEAVWHSI